MKKQLVFCLVFSLCHFTGSELRAAIPVQKSDLKVLYVSGSSDWDIAHFNKDTLAYNQSVQERTIAFETLLKNYFTIVGVIHANDYKQSMSDNYDVTVIDGRPKAIVPLLREKDEAGNYLRYLSAGYLTEDFDRPVVLIGELSEILGRRIGVKNDWYCLCLDAHSHHFRREHPIFNAPFPVEMTITDRPTPEDAYHYAYYHEGPIPDQIPMWAVQTKGYITDKDFRVGMVARPWGYEDSPDAEYISSGVCAKTLDAVAIGRHGNFLHWGFAASPAYMTEEAKPVFANAVIYIAQFAGQGIIARKYNDRIATREYLKELKELCTYESYEGRLKLEEDFAKSMLEEKKLAAEKKEKGEELSRRETAVLSYTPAPPMSFENYVKRYQRDFFDLFGTNTKAYHEFYDANHDYFYGEGFYHLEVDEDVKSLRIPNFDKRILDESIKMLESGKDTEKGKRILERYTLCSFSTPAEWRNWYETNKDLLFFTESGGWLFLVNSRDTGVNDYQAREKRKAIAAIQAGKTDDANPVSVVTKSVNLHNGNKLIYVKIAIHQGYYIYKNVSPPDPFIPATIQISLPDGYTGIGEIKSPFGKYHKQNGTTVYEDEAVFSYEISGTGSGTLKCEVSYQCCDSHICLLPEKKEFTVEL